MEKHKLKLFAETLNIAVIDKGEGRDFLILHGGAGPASVSGLADALSKNARAVVRSNVVIRFGSQTKLVRRSALHA